MSVKITDIAKLTGVSSSSVSRILNKTGRYSEETAKKVRRVAKDLGYYKDRSAADLAKKDTKTIGVIYANSKTNFNNVVIKGILSEADRQNLDVLLMSARGDDYQKLLKIIRNMIERRINMLLIVSIQPTDEMVEMLKHAGVKTVLVGTSTNKDVSFISSDDFLMGYQATMKLVESGYRQIGMAGNDIHHDYVGKLRYQGYLKALADANIEFKPTWLFPGDFSYESGIQAAKYFYGKRNVTAIVGVSDETSFGLLNGLYDLGEVVPKNFAIVSIDGTDICEKTRPKLTSITQNFALMGQLAVSNFDSGDENITVPFKIVPRDTV